MHGLAVVTSKYSMPTPTSTLWFFMFSTNCGTMVTSQKAMDSNPKPKPTPSRALGRVHHRVQRKDVGMRSRASKR